HLQRVLNHDLSPMLQAQFCSAAALSLIFTELGNEPTWNRHLIFYCFYGITIQKLEGASCCFLLKLTKIFIKKR
ncbi:MAG: hypothetical protein FWG82_05345, partial [Oscillospiraceae bacterium]|nr:hypothetical protein [Oscillospiraceae bacterium]